MSPTEGIPEVVAAADIPVAAAVAPTDELSLDSQVAEKVVAQVKHYFTDANLNHDSFMRKGITMHDGWVPFTTLIRFNKLRQLIGVPEDPKVIDIRRPNKRGPRPPPIAKKFVNLLAATVKDGVTDADSVEVNDTGIRRKEPYVESAEWFSRTVHVKGLPYGQEYADASDELTEFFAQHGVVTLMRLRRNPKTRAFKGNLLVEFGTVEQAEAVAQMTDLEYDGHKLAPVLLAAYLAEKVAGDEYIHPELYKPGETYQSYEEWCVAHGREVPLPRGAKPKETKKTKDNKKAIAPKEIAIVPGVLVKFTGVEGEIGVDELKKALGVAGNVKYVDIQTGASEGIVRFKEPIAAQAIESHAEGLPVEDTMAVLKLEAVGAEEETAFYERAKAASDLATARKNANAKNGNGKRSGGQSGPSAKRIREE
ncbi:hypothetical protein GGH94_005892 [Coemansia aciculifera]|uniref:HTH La-type RNA-binding domain-containing protein n=2 Tax=Coemansia TaxID=4863 RepID=A0A9W8M3V9_9FUNG|nr:hypothetical protein GGH94_005892 [Coemansia aciculifera]